MASEMCELPIPSEADLIRRYMFSELPIEPFKITIVMRPWAPEEIRRILRSLNLPNEPFFGGEGRRGYVP